MFWNGPRLCLANPDRAFGGRVRGRHRKERGKWGAYGCECSSTEAGKRAIREALSPARPPGQDRPLNLQVRSTAPQGFAVISPPKPAAKPASKKAIRPHRKREWRYDSKEGRPILKVHRKD